MIETDWFGCPHFTKVLHLEGVSLFPFLEEMNMCTLNKYYEGLYNWNVVVGGVLKRHCRP